MRKETHDPTRTLLLHFEGCAEYAEHARKYVTPVNGYGGSWAGNQTWGNAVDRAQYGDTSLVAQAETLLDKIVIEAARESPLWQNSVAGAMPMVPDYLAGRPDCMRRRVRQPNDRAPIRLYVELTSSGAVSAEDMTKRGTAILALALLLNRDRAVTVNCLVGFGNTPFGHRGSFAVIPLGTSPLDISIACNALTSQAFVRQIGYQLMQQHPESRSQGNWDWDLYPEDASMRKAFVEKLRAALGATAEDIIIPPTAMSDEAIRDPLGFVQRTLAEALKVEQGA